MDEEMIVDAAARAIFMAELMVLSPYRRPEQPFV